MTHELIIANTVEVEPPGYSESGNVSIILGAGFFMADAGRTHNENWNEVWGVLENISQVALYRVTDGTAEYVKRVPMHWEEHLGADDLKVAFREYVESEFESPSFWDWKKPAAGQNFTQELEAHQRQSVHVLQAFAVQTAPVPQTMYLSGVAKFGDVVDGQDTFICLVLHEGDSHPGEVALEEFGEDYWINDTGLDSYPICQASAFSFNGDGQDLGSIQLEDGFLRFQGKFDPNRLQAIYNSLTQETASAFVPGTALLNAPWHALSAADESLTPSWLARAGLVASFDDLVCACFAKDRFGEGALRLEFLAQAEAQEALQVYDEARLLAALDAGFLSVFNHEDNEKYVEDLLFACDLDDSTEEQEFRKIVEDSLPRSMDTVPTILGVLHQIAGRLQDEKEAAGLLCKLLAHPDNQSSSASIFVAAFVGSLDASGEIEVSAAVAAATRKFAHVIKNDFDLLSAVRQAYAQQIVQELFSEDLSEVEELNDWVRESIVMSDVFNSRFSLVDENDRPLSKWASRLRNIPSREWLDTQNDDGGESHRAVLIASFKEYGEELSELVAPSAMRRFQPEVEPQPLAIQVTTIAKEDGDAFNRYFNGVGALLRFFDDEQWSYLDLADLSASSGAGNLNAYGNDVVHPSRLHSSDGVVSFRLAYHGYGMHSLQGRDRLPPETEDPNTTALFRPNDPLYGEDGNKFQVPPALAYGKKYELVVYAISQSGALPRRLREDYRWKPDPEVAGDFSTKQTLRYQRQVALGSATFEPLQGGWDVNSFPDNTFPLFSVRRVVSAYTNGDIARHLDLFRAKDGRGETKIPKDGTAEMLLEDVLRWVQLGDLRVRIDVYNSGAVPESPFATGEFDWPAEGNVQLSLGQNPGGRPYHIPTDTEKTQFVWLRFTVLADDAAATMLDLTTDAMDQPKDPLLILFPESDHWAKDHGRDFERFAINGPRKQAAVFERWFSNLALVDARAETEDEREALRGLVDITTVAQSVGELDEEVYAVLGRLPEPAMNHLEVVVSPLDPIAVEPSQATRRNVIAKARVNLPTLGSLALYLRNNYPRLFEYVAALQSEGADANGSRPIDLKDEFTKLFKALDERWLTDAWKVIVENSNDSPVMIEDRVIKLPSGGVFSVELLTGVKNSDMQGEDAPLDPRFSELADATDENHAYFSNSRLIVETASVPKVDTDLVNKLLTLHPQGAARPFELIADVSENQYWPLRQLHEVYIDQQRWRDLGVPINKWIDPRAALSDRTTRKKKDLTQSIPLDRDRDVKEFENQIFYERDYDVLTEQAVLLPPPAVSKLISEHWEQPTAAYFRYQARYFSRYRGMLRNYVPIKTDWFSVVVFATPPESILGAPPVRALMPLFRPVESQDETPGLLGVVQEPPFARGGLAERLDADIRIGLSYEIGNADISLTNKVTDASADGGEVPFRTHKQVSKEQQQTLRVTSSSQTGLTYDDPASEQQIFSNTALVMTPTDSSGDALDHHTLALRFNRRLDPNWVAGNGAKEATDPHIFSFRNEKWLVYRKFNVGIDADVIRGLQEATDQRLAEAKGWGLLTLNTPGTDIYLNILHAVEEGDDLVFKVQCWALDTHREYLYPDKVTIFRYPLELAQSATFSVAYNGPDESQAWIALYVAVDADSNPQRCAAIQVSRPTKHANDQLVAPNVAMHQHGYTSLPTEAIWTRTLPDRNFVYGIRRCDDSIQRRPVSRIQWLRDDGVVSLNSDGYPLRLINPKRRPNTHQIHYAALFLDEVKQGGHTHQISNAVKRIIGDRVITDVTPGISGALTNVAIIEYLLPARIVLNKGSDSGDNLQAFEKQRIDLLSKRGANSGDVQALCFNINLVGMARDKRIEALTLTLSVDHFTSSIAIKLSNDTLKVVDEIHLVIPTGEEPAEGKWVDDKGEVFDLTAEGTMPSLKDGFDIEIASTHENELWFEVSWLLNSKKLNLSDFDFDWLLPWTDKLNLKDADEVDWSHFIKDEALRHQREVQGLLLNVSPTQRVIGSSSSAATENSRLNQR